jgi:hypothetical protein
LAIIHKGDLAVFGYRSAMQVKIYESRFKSWLLARTSCKKMVIFRNYLAICFFEKGKYWKKYLFANKIHQMVKFKLNLLI